MLKTKYLKFCVLATGLIVTGSIGLASSALAESITIRIASGHPPGVVYAGLMKSYFHEITLDEKAKEDTSMKYISIERKYTSMKCLSMKSYFHEISLDKKLFP